MAFTPNVKMTGDWKRVQQVLERLSPSVLNALQLRIKIMAEQLLLNIRNEVESQSLNLAPLSREYANRKLSEGLDSRTLIATHEYLNKLRYETSGTGANFSITVGGFDNDIHEASGLTMYEIASYLELGTTRMPARPHISVTWQRMKGNMTKQITAEVAKAIADAVRR